MFLWLFSAELILTDCTRVCSNGEDLYDWQNIQTRRDRRCPEALMWLWLTVHRKAWASGAKGVISLRPTALPCHRALEVIAVVVQKKQRISWNSWALWHVIKYGCRHQLLGAEVCCVWECVCVLTAPDISVMESVLIERLCRGVWGLITVKKLITLADVCSICTCYCFQ